MVASLQYHWSFPLIAVMPDNQLKAIEFTSLDCRKGSFLHPFCHRVIRAARVDSPSSCSILISYYLRNKTATRDLVGMKPLFVALGLNAITKRFYNSWDMLSAVAIQRNVGAGYANLPLCKSQQG